jgi:uncharacterized membrane protein
MKIPNVVLPNVNLLLLSLCFGMRATLVWMPRDSKQEAKLKNVHVIGLFLYFLISQG